MRDSTAVLLGLLVLGVFMAVTVQSFTVWTALSAFAGFTVAISLAILLHPCD